MSELTVRRSRGGMAVRHREMGKAEKTAAAGQSRSVTKTAGFTVSETLQRLLTRAGQAEGHIRESRRTLQTGEGVLAEVQNSLARMAELAEKSAADSGLDRAVLQAELEQLRAEIDRMIGSASVGDTPLFLDGDTAVQGGVEALLSAAADSVSAGEEPAIPDWLLRGIAQSGFVTERLLAALGVDKNASAGELLAAMMGSSLENDSAAGYLAALYLGTVIAGGVSSGEVDLQAAMEGLRKLLERVNDGVSPDEAVAQLTGGEFTGFSDFQDQFVSGVAPGLEEFLANLLLGNGEILLPELSLMDLLTGLEGMNLDLLMGLLTAAQDSAAGSETAAAEAAATVRASVLQLGSMQVIGQDLSGVFFDESAGVLTVGGEADVSLCGTAQEIREIRISTSGTVTFHHTDVPVLAVDVPTARIFGVGENVLDAVQLRQGAALVLDGNGFTRIGTLYGDGENVLRLAGGAVEIADGRGEEAGIQAVPVIVEGPASLAGQIGSVSDPGGRGMEPLDVIWQTLLPGWSAITAVAVDGKQAKMALVYPDFARLWLAKADPSHGYPIHTVMFRGRDEAGRPRTRSAYLRWNGYAGVFEEAAMYPNPFTVTGGEAGRDWVYEEEVLTLHILTNRVTAVSGGTGTDGNRELFRGRIAMADGIGKIELALGGVDCGAPSGGALSLGCGNDVTLLLQSETANSFAGGDGFAGISLGDGTTLRVDCIKPDDGGRTSAGTLTATGAGGGAGIGRDSGGTRDRSSRILIRGGVVTASGEGGGAGIGAGKRGAIGEISILGGTVAATGVGGGAGIGGALGAPAGDINIRGGTVTAVAGYHAAAIGAGIQGACGDIRITGTARIVKALGGDPGADIGACLFGSCGKVLISGGADIGRARLRTRSGIPLRIGEGTLTLPQFCLSSGDLQLDRLNVLTREAARAASSVIDTARRQVTQIQTAYGALYARLGHSYGGYYSARRYAGKAAWPVRDISAASALLSDMRRDDSLRTDQLHAHSRQGVEEVRQLLQ